jgi:hypothetical protein
MIHKDEFKAFIEELITGYEYRLEMLRHEDQTEENKGRVSELSIALLELISRYELFRTT